MTPNGGKTSNRQDPGKSIKILILGKDGVGKSAFTVRYLTRRFIGEYDPEMESIYHKVVLIEGETLIVEIKDTCEKKYEKNKEMDLSWADAILLLYSVTDRDSFNHIQSLRNDIDDIPKSKPPPCLLIGNKKDLFRARKVSYVEGRRLAASYSCLFQEISVKEEFEELELLVYTFIKNQCLKLCDNEQMGLDTLKRKKKLWHLLNKKDTFH